MNIIAAEEKITQLIAISTCECFVVAHLALSRLVADHEASMLTVFSWECEKAASFEMAAGIAWRSKSLQPALQKFLFPPVSTPG